MKYDNQNIFAKILRQEIPCQKLFEDEHVLAFNDIAQKAPVHVLVIPKGEYIDFQDFCLNAMPEVVGHFFKVVAQLTQKLELTHGFRVIANSGINGGQEVPHFHMHILGGVILGQ